MLKKSCFLLTVIIFAASISAQEFFLNKDTPTNQINSSKKIYWIIRSYEGTSQKIQCANIDGSGKKNIFTTGGRNLEDLAFDYFDRKIYWCGNGSIKRADLNGNNIETVVRFNDFIENLALDTENQILYWSTDRDAKIRRTDLLNNKTEIFFNIEPKDIAVKSGSFFFANKNIITKTYLNNKSTKQVIFDRVADIALKDNLLYWQGFGDGTFFIKQADTNGGNIKTLVSEKLPPSWAVEYFTIDSKTGELYWQYEDELGNPYCSIKRASSDGKKIETVVESRIGSFRAILIIDN